MRWLWRCIAGGLAALAVGFGLFVWALPSATEPRLPVAAGDGIVVPTGGPERINTGLALQAEAGARLLITGVNPDVSLEAVLAKAGGQPRPDCCLELDRGAVNTVGNADAASEWTVRHGLRRIHLVTSWYHMPRSRLLFARALPGITVIPHPVFPSEAAGGHWWLEPGSWRVVAVEYGKYVWALLSPWDTL